MKNIVLNFAVLFFVFLQIQAQRTWTYVGSFTHDDDVYEASFSPDGSKIVVASKGGPCTLRFYDSNTLAILITYSITGRSCLTAKFSKNGDYVGVGVTNQTVYLFNGSNLGLITTYDTTFTSGAREIDFSYDSKQMIACGTSGSNKGYFILNVSSSNFTMMYKDDGWSDDALCCRFAVDGSYAVGDGVGAVRYYHWNNTIAWTKTPVATKINNLDFSPNMTFLLTGAENQNVRVFYTNNGSQAITSFNDNQKVKGLDYSEDGLYYATGGDASRVRIYNGSFGSQTTSIVNFTTGDEVFSIDFSYDSKRLAAGSKNNKVYIYRMNYFPTISIYCPIQQYKNSSNLCRQCQLDQPGCRRCTINTACITCTQGYYLLAGKCTPCSPECAVCQSASTCLACISTYYLNGTTCQLCLATITGCNLCVSSTNCTSCMLDLYYTNSGSCTSCETLAFCLTCNNSLTCTQCQPGYYIVGGSCIRCIVNCSVCSASSTCSTCNIGYYLSGTTSCLPCPQFCLNCTTNAICTHCSVGYFTSGGLCLPCTSPCASCTTAANVCSSCQIGFYFNSPNCVRCINNCASCTTNTNCSSCIIGYYYVSASFSCSACNSIFPGCQSCNSTACFTCSSGNYYSGTNCTRCTSLTGCVLCNNVPQCTQCLPQFYLTGTTCTACAYPCLTCSNVSACLSCPLNYYYQTSNSTCITCPINCLTCSTSTICSSCSQGYYLNGNSCSNCSVVHSACSQCSSNSVCTTCLPNYFVTSNNCSLCSSGCQHCTALANCYSCQLGFYLSAANTCTRCASPCSTCTASGCNSCMQGYYFSSGSCLSCSLVSSGCIKCNNVPQCLQCDTMQAYFLNSTQCSLCSSNLTNCQMCLTSSVCLICLPGFIPNPSTCSSCSSLITNCFNCYNASTCVLCKPGFYPLSTGQCSACSDGCFSCFNNTVCHKCIQGYFLSSGSCTSCMITLVGCQICTSSGVCTTCLQSYYLSTNVCVPCAASLNGCYQCSSSSTCLSCQKGYYFSSPNCLTCKSIMSGCLYCDNSTYCVQCDRGYSLSSGSCSLCSDPNCINCPSSTCLACASGYSLVSGSCSLCNTVIPNCMFCNLSLCTSCLTGFYLNSSSYCQICPQKNCLVCNISAPTQCITCDSKFYLSTGSCVTCNTTLPNCLQCSSSTTCIRCKDGFYYSGGACLKCTTFMSQCSSCLTSNLCTECNSGYILNPTNNSCLLCHTLIDGCAYCQVNTTCLNCLQGFYLDTGSCKRCSNITGCLLCRDSVTCNYCNKQYYLMSGACIQCNTTIEGCATCSSSSICESCQGNYTLVASYCSIIKPTSSVSPFQQISLSSFYVNPTTLKHILKIKGGQFSRSSIDLTTKSNLAYISQGNMMNNLTILSFQWGPSSNCITYYTNNPFDFTNSSLIKKMDVFSFRSLQETNLQLNVNFILDIDNSTLMTIYPLAPHSGALQVSSSVKDPTFIASLKSTYSSRYYVFGLAMSIVVMIYVFVRTMVIVPQSYDKGQLLAHTFFLKTPALLIEPVYIELISYCQGFSYIDFPFFNQQFSLMFSNPSDLSPDSYKIFYINMSIASTYLLAIMVILGLILVLIIAYYCKIAQKDTILNCSHYLYNLFIAGLTFAGAMAFQGGLMNFQQQFNRYSAFYMVGILILILVIVQAIWSTLANKKSVYKLQIITKGILLSYIYRSPIYYFPIIISLQVVFIWFQLNHHEQLHPKTWTITHMLPNVSLLFLIMLSQSLISIYIASISIIMYIILDIYLVWQDFKIIKVAEALKIDYKISNSMIQYIKDEPIFNYQNFESHQNIEPIQNQKQQRLFVVEEILQNNQTFNLEHDTSSQDL